jgi:uncharacterized protein YjbJ (UPF0337 family)
LHAYPPRALADERGRVEELAGTVQKTVGQVKKVVEEGLDRKVD